MHRRIWLLVCFLLVTLALAIGIGVGVTLPPVSFISTSSTPPLSQAVGGVRVDELKVDEELFALVGQKALVFKYSGGDVVFWIELERNGTTEPFDPGMRAWRQGHPAPNIQTEGYFVFCRQEPDESGTERWVAGGRLVSISTTSSGLKVSTPVVEGEVTASKENRSANGVSVSWNVSLWKEEKKSEGPSEQSLAEKADHMGVSPTGSSSFSGSTEIPAPLPMNRKVCIMTITEKGKKDNPKDKSKEMVAEHVIRVMCKVVSEEDNVKK